MKIMFRDLYNGEEEYRPIELNELKKILVQCDAQNEYLCWGHFVVEIDEIDDSIWYMTKVYEGE